MDSAIAEDLGGVGDVVESISGGMAGGGGVLKNSVNLVGLGLLFFLLPEWDVVQGERKRCSVVVIAHKKIIRRTKGQSTSAGSACCNTPLAGFVDSGQMMTIKGYHQSGTCSHGNGSIW